MLDVHPPHSSMHSWRDVLLQLFVVTLGILIALSLEGCVEWLHHRHLLHEAQASLYTEIKTNAGNVRAALEGLHRQQTALQTDVPVLNAIIDHPEAKQQASLDVTFSIKTFEEVSWRTAQATGAVGYMPYAMAQQYSRMYSQQNELMALEQQAARDATLAIAPLLNLANTKQNPTREEAVLMKRQIEVLQSDLLLVDRYLQSMDQLYRDFLTSKDTIG